MDMWWVVLLSMMRGDADRGRRRWLDSHAIHAIFLGRNDAAWLGVVVTQLGVGDGRISKEWERTMDNEADAFHVMVGKFTDVLVE